MKEMNETVALVRRDRRNGQRWLTDGKKAVAYLLVVIMLERIAFYTIIGSASTFASDYLRFPQWGATVMSIMFMGSVYFCAPIFGWIADCIAGYFVTLAIALAFYVVGSSLICCAAAETDIWENDIHSARSMYIAGIIVMAFSASAIRTTLIPYMLEQLADGTESHVVIARLVSVSFFTINIGGAIGLIGTAFLWKHGIKNNEEYSGFFWAYLMPPLSLLVAFLIFIICRKAFKTHGLKGMSDYTPSLRDILSTGCGCYRSRGPPHYDRKQLPVKDEEEEKQDRLDEHRERLGVLVPVLSSVVIFFAVQGQIPNTFVDQARHMDVGYDTLHTRNASDLTNNITTDYCSSNTSTSQYVLPPSLMTACDPLAVILTVPIAWYVISPLYQKIRGRIITMLDRIQFGMIAALLACIATIAVEVARLRYGQIRHICLKVGNIPQLEIYSSVSPIAQIPQGVLMGVSEAFALVAVQEFVLSRAPRQFRCTAFGVLNFTFGVGDYIRALILFIMTELKCYYQSIDPNGKAVTVNALVQREKESKAWVFFVTLTVLLGVSTISFCFIKYRHRDVQRMERVRIGQTSGFHHAAINA